MKIVIDARMYSWPGIGRYTRHLLKELEEISEKHEYIVLMRSNEIESYQPRNENFTKLVADFEPFSFNEQLGFAWFLYKLKPNLVHFTHINHPVLYLRKRITNIHDLTLLKFSNNSGSKIKYYIKQLGFRFALRHAVYSSKYVITISNYVRKSILAHYRVKPRRFVTTYPSVDISTVKPKTFDKLRYEQFILYVGAAYPFKNLDRLVDAFSQLHASNPNLHLVLVGRQEHFYRHLKTSVKKNKMPNILFLGFVPDNQLVWLYKNAQVFVFPSLSEGFGLPGLEAMSYGLPVISSKATCLPEIYGKAAHYFDPNDVVDIADSISNVLVVKSLRVQLISRGYKQVNKYSWRKMAEQTLEIYNKTL